MFIGQLICVTPWRPSLGQINLSLPSWVCMACTLHGLQCERSLKKKVDRNGHVTTSDAKGYESKIENNGEEGY